MSHSSVVIDVEQSDSRGRIRSQSTAPRALIVLLLAIAAPLQVLALFFSSGDVMLSVFGLYVGAIVIAMTSRYVMSELYYDSELEFSLQISAVMCASLFVSYSLGTSLHYWSIFSNPLVVQPTTLKRPLRDTARNSPGLPIYDFSHLTFDVSRAHVGQYEADDGSLVCVAPLAMRKQLAKSIASIDDVPPNWAVCRGAAPQLNVNAPPGSGHGDADDDDSTFDCGAFYRSAIGSDADRVDALNADLAVASSVNRHTTAAARGAGDTELEDAAALLACLRGWASLTLGHDVAYVDAPFAHDATQAAKEALQRWAPLADDIENPLQTFDDDEDLRHLTFVRLESACCAVHSAHFSLASLLTWLSGNFFILLYTLASSVVRVVRVSTRRRHDVLRVAVFVLWLALLAVVEFRF